jgi:two-component system KDP operon response regulator KdpE
MSSVLVVEDDPALARSLEVTLRAQGYQAFAARDASSALSTIAQLNPDVVVLGLGSRDPDRVGVLRLLRCSSAVPVIVLSTRSAFGDKIEALDAGADDYLTKPFDMAELLARVRAVVRRLVGTPDDEAQIISTPDFTIDLGARRIVRNGAPVRLTPNEWALLEILVRHAGRIVPAKQLLTDVWGAEKANQTHYLRVYFAQLRHKLEPDPAHPKYLITEHSVGYRFQESDRAG